MPPLTRNPHAPTSARMWTVDVAAGLIILLVIVACYWRAIGVPFVFDDYPGIVRNLTIRHLSAPGQVLNPPVTAAGAAGRPLVNASLAVDYALHGEAPAGYHLTNILLHVFTAGLLFAVVRRVMVLRTRGAGPSPQTGPRAPTVGALALTLLWAAHPLLTETVVCVIQRNEIMVAASMLATLYAVLRAHSAEHPAPWLCAGIVAAWLGGASKEVAVVTPVLVGLFDWLLLQPNLSAMLCQRGWFYAGIAASWLLIGWLAFHNQDRAGTVGFGLGITPLAYALTQCRAIATYAKLVFWPHPLVLDYGVPLFSLADVWPELAGIGIAGAAIVIGVARRSLAAFLGAAFLILLAPSSSVVPLTTQTVAEHRMYLPTAVVVIGVGVAVRWLVGVRWLLPAAIAAIALAGATIRRTADFRSEIALWTDTVAKAPRNARAIASLAGAYLREGRSPEAIAEYRRALAVRPDYADAHNDLGLALGRTGKPEEAAAEFEAAARLKPDDPDIQYNLAGACAALGRTSDAARHFEKALRLRPMFHAAENNYGKLLLDEGRTTAALDHLTVAARLEPANPAARNNLALALAQAGRRAEAIEQFRAVVALQPDSAAAHNELGLALRENGDMTQARREFERAITLKPDFAAAQINAAMAQLAAGEAPAAAEHYQAAIRLLPGNAELHYNYAAVLAQLGRRGDAMAELNSALRLKPDFPEAKQALRSLEASR